MDQHIHGGAVKDDVMDIEQEIVFIFRTGKDTHTEQRGPGQIKRANELREKGERGSGGIPCAVIHSKINGIVDSLDGLIPQRMKRGSQSVVPLD
jgi:hypothetical protein